VRVEFSWLGILDVEKKESIGWVMMGGWFSLLASCLSIAACLCASNCLSCSPKPNFAWTEWM
jgi:hypothetical protein